MLEQTLAVKISPATWIWSQWLNEYHRADLQYKHFTHYEFVEDKSKRSEIEANLTALLYHYHTSSPVSMNLLAQLKFRQLASTLTRNNDQRPHISTTRSGNLIEILACEFAIQQEYDVPVLRLRYNPNPDQSMKGDDILGFRFASASDELDALLVGEGKFRSRFTRTAVEEAYSGLQSKARSYPTSMEFVSTILTLEGNQLAAAKIKQLRQRLAVQDRRVAQSHLLFLGTIGQPQNPFEYLEEQQDELLEDLVAVNIVFQDDFQSWIAGIYEKEYRFE